MIALLLFLAGVVGLATSEQFHGQYAIATVVLILGAISLVAQVVLAVSAARFVRRTRRDINASFTRNRRGF